ncbi:MAG: E3 binding domain-containing protein, partial [SAR324 cluster bacterium]|nr:E3 binding domain-containing protein [SAR324 cluster bacterium]
MEIEIVVPELGESITEATVSAWLKSPGDAVAEGDVLLELETDKVMVEVPGVQAGVLTEILKRENEKVNIGEVLGKLDTDSAAQARPEAPRRDDSPRQGEAPRHSNAPAPPDMAAQPAAQAAPATATNSNLTPAVQRMVAEHQLDPSTIPGTGRRGQITKTDVVNFMAGAAQHGVPAGNADAPAPAGKAGGAAPAAQPGALAGKAGAPASTPRTAAPAAGQDTEERVPMSRMRQRIAERLLEA